METVLETPLKSPAMPGNTTPSGYRTPPRNQETGRKIQSSDSDSGNKTATPDRLKVPKAFKYPERYRSPTDLIMSPVSKGLLARSRKTGSLLPPANIHPKGAGSGFSGSGSESFSSLRRRHLKRISARWILDLDEFV